jgi:XTP/dITP diphosphohydrolase
VRKIVLATTNKGKVVEIKDLLAALTLEVVGLDYFTGVPQVAETGKSFLDNALLKARTIAQFTHELTLADDSGLEVDFLGGEPGVYSARYGEPGWNDRRRYEYLLGKLEGVPPDRRKARFRCAVAVYDPARNLVITGEGVVAGRILTGPKGSNGFGYDPVFYIAEKGCAMAELPEAEKNQLSHRSKAIRSIIPQLAEICNSRG